MIENSGNDMQLAKTSGWLYSRTCTDINYTC